MKTLNDVKIPKVTLFD